MPTRLTQAESHASGSAALHITGPNAERLSEEDVEISIVQPGQVDLYLDPRNPDHPWSTTVFRFRPLNPRREGAALLLDIDYGVTYHLRANQPYKLKLRGTNGTEVEERFTGSANLRRPTTIPRGWTPPPDPRGPVAPPSPVELASSTAPSVAEPAPLPVVETEPIVADTTDSEKSTQESEAEKPPEPATEALRPEVVVTPPPPIEPKPRKPWLALAAVLVLLVGAGAWWYLNRGAQDQSQVAQPDPDASLDSIRRFLAGNPDPAAARDKGETLAAGGKLLDGQFLLFKYAAERGDAKAAHALGAFYDPHTWAKDKSPLPAPNPLEAARWHKMAAEAGDAESQYRYGMLLREGGTDEPNGPEMAVAWLRKSAEQGNSDAKKALGQ
jgi:Sel1 repeat-containing protein